MFKRKKIVVEEDLFIRRLPSLTIGEGMLCEGNIESIKYVIKQLPTEGCVLEIGSYAGRSTNLIAYLLSKYNKENLFFACDAWIYEGYLDASGKLETTIDGRVDVLRSDYSEYMKSMFTKTTQFLNPSRLPYAFHERSELFFKSWTAKETKADVFGRQIELGCPICFAYIDGDHSYEAAWNDFVNVSENLIVGGFILLDDSADGMNFGSAKMMKEIKQDKRFKVIKQNPNYLIQRIK